MSAENHIREGNLAATKSALQESVRREPAVAKHRVFLFQVLSLTGEWDRALTQLEVLREMDPSTMPMVQTYSSAIQAERFREEVFAGRKSPVLLGEPDAWLAALIEALRLQADGRMAEAKVLRDRAFDEAPASPGTLDGTPFEWLADADNRLGPVLELIANGRYYWVPFSNLTELHVEAPTDLRDLVWCPVRAVLVNGGEVFGLIPSRYAGTASAQDDALRLSRRTDWIDRGDGCFAGSGQRMLASDAAEFPILELRDVVFGAGPSGADAA